MSNIRAVVVDPAAQARLRLGEVPMPTPLPNEALVRVAAVSSPTWPSKATGNKSATWPAA